MDHYSILEEPSTPVVTEEDLPRPKATASKVGAGKAKGSATPSVSAGIAAANALLSNFPEVGPRFPGEDAGRSLAAMAQADLDATLQLLVERALYITGATGAAIALRRGDHFDMVCRASAGTNAPELGALLSMEFGLSGESVRTRQLLRCDDAERDSRVNHEVCRELGIASVVVMPMVSDENVLGVFELFSGQPGAFNERDLSALMRLSEMVETAVRFSTPPPRPELPELNRRLMPVDRNRAEMNQVEMNQAEINQAAIQRAKVNPAGADQAPIKPAEMEHPRLDVPRVALASIEDPPPPEAPAICATPLAPKAVQLPEQEAQPVPHKPLFWSVLRAQENVQPKASAQTITVPIGTVPAVLRKLHKCEACGFPVSQGRTLCVECEEKHWRGQLVKPATTTPPAGSQEEDLVLRPQEPPAPVALAFLEKAQTGKVETSATSPAAIKVEISSVSGLAPRESREKSAPSPSLTPNFEKAAAANPLVPTPSAVLAEASPVESLATASSTVDFLDDSPFMSASLQSESWLARNKYIVITLLVIAVVVAAVAWLR